MVIRPKSDSADVCLIQDERLPVTQVIAEQATPPKQQVTEEETDEAIETMRGKMSDDLTSEQKERLWDVLYRNRKVWLQPTFGKVRMPAQFVATGRPVKDKLRPLNGEMREELEKQVSDLLALGVIRLSKSPWASSPVFVRKANGTWRMAIDYRRVNKQIKTDGYPIPLLWEQLQVAGGHLYYARLDGKSGFFNVPLSPESRELTAFNTHKGLFEYNVLPFGVKNSPAEFQRVMDAILGKLYGHGVLCYIDDIVIFADCFEEWVALIDKVFRRLWKGGVYIEPKKCELGSRVIHVLGHVISKEGVSPNPKKIEAIQKARPPTNRKELMSFLGLVGFVRRFVPNYSENTVNLTALLKKRAVFTWSEECKEEFERLKGIIVRTIMLSVPRGRGPYVILSDASDFAIGSVLAQWREKELHLLEFASHKFTSHERNWSTREKEAYAIRWSVQRFEPYVKGAKIYVLTDHASLQWMDSATTGKIQRWALYLQQFDVQVKAISGVDNGMADWFSRSVEMKDDEADEEIDMISNPVLCLKEEGEEEPAANEYTGNPYLPNWDQWVEASRSIPEEDKNYVQQQKDGLWYSRPNNRLYVPPILRESIMYFFHAGPHGGHFGVAKTYRRLRKWFYWPKQKANVADYIRCCLPCKRTTPLNKRYLRQTLEKTEAFQLISIDHVGPRIWNQKRVYYITIIDHFSRFVMLQAVDNLSSKLVVKTLQERWIATFGAPQTILVDQGKAFTSRVFQMYVCSYVAADLVYAGVGYPQGNAINEAVHKGIEASITARRQYEPATSFEEVLSDAALAYNSTPHSATGYSPYFLLFGVEMMLPGLQTFHEELLEAKRRAQQREAKRAVMMRAILNEDANLRLHRTDKLQVGDSVVYHLDARERDRQEADGEASLIKYAPAWSVPSVVTRVTDNTVEVKIEGGKTLVLSRRLVRKIGSDVPSSLQELNMVNIPTIPRRPKEEPTWKKDGLSRKRLRVEKEDDLEQDQSFTREAKAIVQMKKG